MISIFGCFMLLSFTAAWFVFRSEYRRKEREGLIHPFIRTARSLPPAAAALIGFIPGSKLTYWFLNSSIYIGTPDAIIFSWKGNVWGGIIAGMLGAWLAKKQYRSPRQEEIHPYQLMDPLLLWCGLFGFGGAIAFAAFENPQQIGINGLNYYGALIAGTGVYLYINRKVGIRPAIAADIGSPGMMLAYAIGRMGCHLAGDGDWGIANTHPKPSWLPAWAWASTYPHNSIRQGKYIEGCSGRFCTELVAPVFPTPLYESILCTALFLLLWSLRRHIKRPGNLFAIFAILNGTERFFIEYIRITPRYPLGPWNPSQAQLIAIAWIITGLVVFRSGKKLSLSSSPQPRVNE